jgi:hypothetical protein
MPVLDLKKEYNALLMRHFKAASLDEKGYFENMNNLKKWQPEYKTVVESLSKIILELTEFGETPTGDEILGGFDLEE